MAKRLNETDLISGFLPKEEHLEEQKDEKVKNKKKKIVKGFIITEENLIRLKELQLLKQKQGIKVGDSIDYIS